MIGPLAVNHLLDVPLFAIGVQDVITVVVVLAVMIISALSQYFNKKKEEAARQRRLEEQAKRRAAMAELEQRKQPAGPPPPPRQARPQEMQRPFGPAQQHPQRPAAAPVDADVAAEIRDFLERAATGQPAGQASARPKPMPAKAAVVPAQPVTDQERRQAEAIRAKKLAEAKRRQAAAARVPSVATQPHLPTIDHDLGSLKKQASRQPSPPATVAAAPTPAEMAYDVAAMFASTENIRQAIVINEILTRPVHRWE